jgi:hypothetical protein
MFGKFLCKRECPGGDTRLDARELLTRAAQVGLGRRPKPRRTVAHAFECKRELNSALPGGCNAARSGFPAHGTNLVVIRERTPHRF